MKKKMLMLALVGIFVLLFTKEHIASAHAIDSQSQQVKQTVVHVYHSLETELKSHYKDLHVKWIKKDQGMQQHGVVINDSLGKSKVSSGSPNNASLTGTVSAYEKEVVTLTNKERTSRGLKPLTLDTKLSKMARDKSQDMANKNYFSHQSPTYGSPFDMMKTYNISYTSAGENIAAGQKTPEDVVSAWMNSEGHRENILNPHYTAIGVGYVQGGSYGSYWTQDFIGK